MTSIRARGLRDYVPYIIGIGACLLQAYGSPHLRASTISSQLGPDPTGSYTLQVTVGDECSALPEIARDRTYSAVVTAEDDHYTVTLSGADFLQDPFYCDDTYLGGCDRFRAWLDGDGLRFLLVDGEEDPTGTIIEHIPPGTWLWVAGRGWGPVTDSGIQATLDGGLWYCPTVSDYLRSCPEYIYCRSSNVQFTFTRQ
jgi:hypothetical protein